MHAVDVADVEGARHEPGPRAEPLVAVQRREHLDLAVELPAALPACRWP